MMKHETRKKLIRLSLGAVIFLVVWGLLALTGSSLVDDKAVQEWVAKKEWMGFFNPDIRNQLVGFWRPLAALLFTASLVFPRLKKPTDYLAKRFFLKGPPLVLNWGPADYGLPQFEFLFFYPPGGCHTSGLILMNKRSEARQINRIELDAAVFHRVSDLGTEVWTGTGASPLHFEGGERDEEANLEWKKTGENSWAIDIPFALAGEAKAALPGLGLGSDDAEEKATEQLRNLVGMATLGVELDIRIQTEQGITSQKLSAPLRVFQGLEEGGDGGIGALISKLPAKTEAEKSLLQQAYGQARQADFQMRKTIAQRLNALEAEKKLEAADQAIALKPNDPHPHYARGNVLIGLGRNDEALASLDKALRLGLDTPDLHLDRARALRGLSRPEEALDEVARVLAAHPDQAVAHAERGRALVDLGRHEDALAAHNRATELDPESAEAHYGRGLALFNLEEDEAALAAFDRAVELDPNSGLAHVGRALALSGHERDGEVLDALEKALNLDFDDPDLLNQFETLLSENYQARFHQLLDLYNLKPAIEDLVVRQQTDGDGAPSRS